jgi:hypothetical protein
MKLKVGNKVTVRRDLIDSREQGSNGWYSNYEMITMAGEVVTIFAVKSDHYHIIEDDGEWGWTDEMFDFADASPLNFLQADGMVVFREKDNYVPALHKIVQKADGTFTFTTENGCGWIDASDYDEDGIHQGGTVSKNKDYDLMEIYAPAKESKYAGKFVTTGRELLWKRAEVKELTLEEVTKLAGCDVSQLKIKK